VLEELVHLGRVRRPVIHDPAHLDRLLDRDRRRAGTAETRAAISSARSSESTSTIW
jgi:hypothetical protein